jgi:ABC-type sugar transport system substrate-binding protein
MKIPSKKVLLGVVATIATATMLSTSVMPATAADVDFRKAKPGYGKGIVIGFIGLDDAIGFGKDVGDSVRREAKKAGATLVYCDGKLSAATALACAKTFKLKKVQGYLNFNAVSDAAAAICKAGPNVPVISIDIEQDPCQTAFMGANNSKAGFVAGEALGKFFKTKFQCEFDAWVSLEDFGVGLVNEARMGGYSRRARMHSQRFQAKIRSSLLQSTTKESRELSQLLRLLDVKRISTEQVKVHLRQHGAISRPIQTGSEVLLITQSVTVRSVFLTFLT